MINRIHLIVSFIIFCTISQHGSEAERILAIFPVESKSHNLMFSTVIKELVTRGHDITIASQYPLPEKYNTTFVDLRNIFEIPMYSIEFLKNMTPWDNVPDIIDYNFEVCINALKKTAIKDLLNNKYDLMITEVFGCDCFMAFAHKLNIPVVGIISSVTLPWTVPMIGHYENPSYVPSYFLHYGQQMTLLERFTNTMFQIMSNMHYEWTSNMKIQPFVEEIVGPLPPMRSISRNVSLILTNSHFSINQVKPTYPQLIEVGGLHIPKEIPPLPQDLQVFYEQSPHGTIYFSLGSYADPETFPRDKMDAILNVLGSLPQKILWKMNGSEIEDLPDNVLTSSWVPQMSVLCDERTKLFISHGGLLSIQESMHCGVPLLGIPLFADQYMNLKAIQDKGAGLTLRYDDINEETLAENIKDLLQTKSYRQNAKKLSTLFKDRPQHPLHTAVYWIEYILRHKGAGHLKSPAQDLEWYQYILLDVAIILHLIVAGLLGTLYYLYKIISRLRRKEIKETNVKKKKN